MKTFMESLTGRIYKIRLFRVRRDKPEGLVEDISNFPGYVNLFIIDFYLFHSQISKHFPRHYELILSIALWRWRVEFILYFIHRNQHMEDFKKFIK